jgi:hypothetical protein
MKHEQLSNGFEYSPVSWYFGGNNDVIFLLAAAHQLEVASPSFDAVTVETASRTSPLTICEQQKTLTHFLPVRS